MQHTEYGFDIQKLYLEMMLTDSASFVRCQSIFDHTLFDRKLQIPAEFLSKYVEAYNVLPTYDIINSATGSSFKQPENLKDANFDWLLDEFEKFTRHKGLERAILESADDLEKGELGQVEERVKKAVQIGLQKDLGTDYFANPRERLMKIKDNNGQMSCGWKALDDLLYGGLNRGEISIFAGGSGCVTADTLVEVIEIVNPHMVKFDSKGNHTDFYNTEREYSYLLQFYTGSEIESYTRGLSSLLIDLYIRTQPKKVPIVSLMDKSDNSSFMVSSPDGWVSVLDCVEKIKDELYEFNFESGRTIIASHDHLYQKPDLSWHYARLLVVDDVLLAVEGVDRIKSIEKINKSTRVYDLSVNHANHRYYTNGICSHNTGKSLFLANLGVNYALAGMNVLYVTLELSEELVSMRIDSMMTGTSTREVFKKIDDVELKVKMLGKKAGSFQVKYMPSGKTANDIRAYLKEYEVKTGKKIDVLLVDYLDLLMPNGKKISAENLYIKDKYVSEELRNLAMEKSCVLISAAQLNRCLSLDTLVEVNGNKLTIDKVQVGDYLTSNAGPVEVLEVLPITKRPVFEITTKSGKKIKCSAQHKFPTKDGLKTIETGLMAFDTLFTTDSEDMIYSIEYIGMEDTLDINVSGNRLFYANDILTHNCAVDEVEFDHSHISGGLSKIQTADNVFGIFTSRAMRERGMYQVQCMKTRNSSGVGQKIDLAFDVDTLRITDVDDSGGYQPSQSPGSAILSSIRQRSTVEDNEPKVKAEVQSSKIRDLLNNLPKN